MNLRGCDYVHQYLANILSKVRHGNKKEESPGSRNSLSDVLDHIIEKGFHPRTIIDVGVAYGTEGLYGKFSDVKYLMVEPLIEYENVCRDLARKYDGEYVLAAASNAPGELTINVHPDLSGSSIFNESEGRHVDGTPRRIPAVTLDDLCKEKHLTGPYLLKIDTQGSELIALDGAQDMLKSTEVVLLEAFLFQFYKGIPLIADVISYMKVHGFVVYDIFGGINRLLDNALAQVDLVFVRENGIFRTSNSFASDQQREAFREKRMRHLNPH